ncbi:hypothetical protein DJ561_05535 [Streptococcus pyogenes]|nr:hypothetical protein DJ561_05535 [Streptococcus pyogenes]
MSILYNGFLSSSFQRCFFQTEFSRFFSAKCLAYLHSLMSYKNTPNVRVLYLTFGVQFIVVLVFFVIYYVMIFFIS